MLLPSFEPAKRVSGTPEEQARIDALASAVGKARLGEFQAEQGLRMARIRRDWRDVVFDEDASVFNPDKKDGSKVLGDLEGATVSYSHDGKAKSDTWSAHGAIILPYTLAWLKGSSFSLRRFAVAPSITYDRVTTNGKPTDETDSLLYRLGFYMDFWGSDRKFTPAFNYGLQIRAAGVYATDHDHRAGLAGFEMDFEPRFRSGSQGILGYRTVLIKKIPAQADKSDNSIIEMQLRAWLHMEGGDIQDTGKAWTGTKGSFFRMGPTVQLQLAMPSLPGGRELSLTTVYSYLAAISGSNSHPSYFRSTLSYDLFKDKELNQKVAINASYEWGGLNFTKQQVDTFTIGFGVLF
jgi:hypothetical protein